MRTPELNHLEACPETPEREPSQPIRPLFNKVRLGSFEVAEDEQTLCYLPGQVHLLFSVLT